MSDIFQPASLTPVEFEREVKAMLERSGSTLRSFVTRQRERVTASDGEYEIDVTVRFEALGADFLVLVECKHQKRPVEREDVQVLADRVRAVGAHKGMAFATSKFQRGALEYARAHGIALIRIADAESLYLTRSDGGRAEPPPQANLPAFLGVLTSLDSAGKLHCTNLASLPQSLLEFMIINQPPRSAAVGNRPS